MRGVFCCAAFLAMPFLPRRATERCVRARLGLYSERLPGLIIAETRKPPRVLVAASCLPRRWPQSMLRHVSPPRFSPVLSRQCCWPPPCATCSRPGSGWYLTGICRTLAGVQIQPGPACCASQACRKCRGACRSVPATARPHQPCRRQDTDLPAGGTMCLPLPNSGQPCRSPRATAGPAMSSRKRAIATT